MQNSKILNSFFICFSILFLNVSSSFAISIVIQVQAKLNAGESIFLAGSCNNWNPNDTNYLFHKIDEGKYELTLSTPSIKELSFKFTKGNWNKVECQADGSDISNRIIILDENQKEAIFIFEVSAWKDVFQTTQKKSTASKNVFLINENFPLNSLGVKRAVWIYLPPDYSSSNKKYPVLYMHDGQNLFDESRAAFGEWGVDEYLDSLYERTGESMIVVGIDNGGIDRLAEYCVYDFGDESDNEIGRIHAKGQKYLESILLELKPLIDKKYRTYSDADHTYMMGSSMGALISLYAYLRYPKLIGKVALLSPAFWTNEKELLKEIDSKSTLFSGDVLLSIGDLEGQKHIQNMNNVAQHLNLKSSKICVEMIISNSGHNEQNWRTQMPNNMSWLLSNSK